MKKTSGLVITTALLATSSLGHAAGFALIEQGGSGMGNAYAGAAAVAEDATTIYFNPAGMSYLPDSQLVGAIHAIKPSADFNNNGSRSGVGTPMTGGDGGDAGDWAYVPNLYFAKAITDSFRVGLGVNAPFGLKTEYNDTWVGRYHAIKSELTTININPSLSFKVNDAVSLGAGVSYQRASADLTQAVDFGTICYAKVSPAACAGALHLNPQKNDGEAKIKGDDWAWGYNLGVIFQPSQDTRAGLAYRSRVHHELDGTVKYSGVPTTFAASPSFKNSDAKAKVVLPDTASASIFHTVNDHWDVMGDITWTHWSLFHDLTVERDSGVVVSSQPEKWENTLRYSLGTNYRYNEALKLRAGVAYDESPVSSTYRTPRIPDNNRTWLSLGANYKFNANSSMDVGYTHIFIQNASVDQTSTSGGGKLVGDYNSDVNILSLQYTHNF